MRTLYCPQCETENFLTESGLAAHLVHEHGMSLSLATARAHEVRQEVGGDREPARRKGGRPRKQPAPADEPPTDTAPAAPVLSLLEHLDQTIAEVNQRIVELERRRDVLAQARKILE